MFNIQHTLKSRDRIRMSLEQEIQSSRQVNSTIELNLCKIFVKHLNHKPIRDSKLSGACYFGINIFFLIPPYKCQNFIPTNLFVLNST